MFTSETINSLPLNELSSEKVQRINGETAGEVCDDPNDPSDDGCIDNPLEDIMD